MDDDQQFCLRWNNHQSTLISVFDTLLENGTLVDCTLAAEGKFLKAHKVVLSACSPYFATLLSQQYDKHPIFILKDVKFQELRAMMDYMYRGEVNISQDQLAALLKAAESLQIKGLSDSRGGGGGGGSNNSTNMPSQAHKNDAKHVPAPKASGLTVENNKRALLRPDFDADVSGSREGSTSPSTRKRKKVSQRRKSLGESNNLLDNHDQHSNSSSHSNNQQPLSTSATSAPSNNLSVTNKQNKTEQEANQDHHDNGDDEMHTAKRSKHGEGADNKQESELMIEPKNEYDDGDEDDDGDENVEDLTMDDLEDLDQAGPSHGGEGSSQGYHWQMDSRSQEGQESAGQHRDAQDDEEKLTCVPEIFAKVKVEDSLTERFPCATCGKSYLRRRHLQRHTRDECVNIPPRFHCELCPSKFRRKYHLVRHLSSKHGIITPPTPPTNKSSAGLSTKVSSLQTQMKKELTSDMNHDERVRYENLLMNNFDKFSVEALMMKQENFQPTQDFPPMSEMNSDTFAQMGLQQTFQNLKNLFVNYSLNNVTN